MSEKPFVNTASWIWSAEGSHSAPAPENATPSHYQVRYFRRTFEVADPALVALKVDLSADSRYLFFCNGTFVRRSAVPISRRRRKSCAFASCSWGHCRCCLRSRTLRPLLR